MTLAAACRRFPPGPRWFTMTARPQARPCPPRSDPGEPRPAQPAPSRYEPTAPTTQDSAMLLPNPLRSRWTNLLAASLGLWLGSSTARAAASGENAAPAIPARVEFNRDVRPILSDNCFLCHGPDKGRRKGDLRLDLRDEALKAEAVVPGKPDESARVGRL